MNGIITTIGIDTGDTAGMTAASWRYGERIPYAAHAFQCDGSSAAGLLLMLLNGVVAWTDIAAASDGEVAAVTAVQIEAFDNRPGKRGTGLHGTNPGRIQQQIATLAGICGELGVPVHVRQVADVKKWATDARLQATVKLWELTRGMPKHAADGSRHGLYTAVHDCGLPDPLSRRPSGIKGAVADAPPGR